MIWLAHHWQDTIFGAGGFFFALSLVPTLRSKTAEVPLKTSVPTACILGLYVVAEWTVHLRLAAVAGVFSAGAWGLVAVFRRPKLSERERFPILYREVAALNGCCSDHPGANIGCCPDTLAHAYHQGRG